MDALELSPLRNATVVSMLTDPAVTLSTVTVTGLPDSFSMLAVRVATNCRMTDKLNKLHAGIECWHQLRQQHKASVEQLERHGVLPA